MLACGLNLFEQRQQVIGVLVGDKALGPEAQGLAADADGAYMLELGGQQRLDAGSQVAGLHHQRVAAGDQHIGHLGMAAQVVAQLARFLRGNAQILVTDKLCPAEAEGAVAVTHLAGAGEEQHRLPVLMLQPLYALAVELGYVVFQLPGWVRVQGGAHFGDYGVELLGRPFLAQGLGHALEIFRGQHAALGEGQLEDGVVRHCGPVDQLVDDVLVDPERENAGHHAHVEALLFGQHLQLWNLIQLPGGIDAESFGFERRGQLCDIADGHR